MARFDVHRNANKATREEFPYLLDVQAELFSDLRTRVVVPLMRSTSVPNPMTRLNPAITVEGKRMVMVTTDLAGVPTQVLGPVVANLEDRRTDIVGAIDFLLTGA